MDDKHRDMLRRNRSKLRRDLEPKKLLPLLFAVLDEEDEGEVMAKGQSQQEMNDKLLDILPRKGPTAFEVFVKALRETQPFLAKSLLQESGPLPGEISTDIKDSMETNDPKQIDKYQKTIVEMEGNFISLKEEGSKMRARIKEFEEQVQNMEQESSEMRAIIKQLEEHLQDKELECSKLRARNVKLEEALASKNEQQHQDSSRKVCSTSAASDATSEPSSSGYSSLASLNDEYEDLEIKRKMIQDVLGLTNKLQEHLHIQHKGILQRQFRKLQEELCELRNELQEMVQRNNKRLSYSEIPLERISSVANRIYSLCKHHRELYLP